MLLANQDDWWEVLSNLQPLDKWKSARAAGLLNFNERSNLSYWSKSDNPPTVFSIWRNNESVAFHMTQRQIGALMRSYLSPNVSMAENLEHATKARTALRISKEASSRTERYSDVFIMSLSYMMMSLTSSSNVKHIYFNIVRVLHFRQIAGTAWKRTRK